MRPPFAAGGDATTMTAVPQAFTRILRLPLFLLLFPLFIVLNIENNYQHMIEYRFVWREISVLVLLPLAGFAVASLLLRSLRLGALFSVPLYVVFYFGASMKGWADQHLPALLGSFFLWLPLLLLAFVAYFLRLRRRRPRGTSLLVYANLVLLLYILVELARFAGSPKSGNDLGDRGKTISRTYTVQPGSRHPDIYYVVLDGYTASPVLGLLGLDNSRTDSFLTRKGFYLAPGAQSAYNFTAFSLSSTFNLDYLQRVDTTHLFYDNDYLPAVYSMFRSEWLPILRKEGYTCTNLSNFPMQGAPMELPPFDIWFQTSLYRPYNFLDFVNKSIGWHLPRRLRIRTSFDDDSFERGRHAQLQVLPQCIRQAVPSVTDAPRFVYAHFLVPHGPFNYDSTGHFRAQHPEGFPGYLEHIGYANKLLRQTVDDIFRLQPKGRPFLLIVQGDHGVHHREPERRQLFFSVLSAFYFSDGDYSRLSPGLSNVNTFRVVANTYFGQHFPLLPARTVYLKTGTDLR
ncbi:sulfatase-like hydrolase/transferase [Flaviaesturariibacter terrae]